MEYHDRLLSYEREKMKLAGQNLTDREYECEIKKLADKWDI